MRPWQGFRAMRARWMRTASTSAYLAQRTRGISYCTTYGAGRNGSSSSTGAPSRASAGTAGLLLRSPSGCAIATQASRKRGAASVSSASMPSSPPIGGGHFTISRARSVHISWRTYSGAGQQAQNRDRALQKMMALEFFCQICFRRLGESDAEATAVAGYDGGSTWFGSAASMAMGVSSVVSSGDVAATVAPWSSVEGSAAGVVASAAASAVSQMQASRERATARQ
mmetsp:Transcript_38261/g.81574  ORF Transcript_38261/g.81574 Transcript_38261/m.81574 type:complete len:226 (-) Transcript_38261:162-839(-)